MIEATRETQTSLCGLCDALRSCLQRPEPTELPPLKARSSSANTILNLEQAPWSPPGAGLRLPSEALSISLNASIASSADLGLTASATQQRLHGLHAAKLAKLEQQRLSHLASLQPTALSHLSLLDRAQLSVPAAPPSPRSPKKLPPSPGKPPSPSIKSPSSPAMTSPCSPQSPVGGKQREVPSTAASRSWAAGASIESPSPADFLPPSLSFPPPPRSAREHPASGSASPRSAGTGVDSPTAAFGKMSRAPTGRLSDSEKGPPGPGPGSYHTQRLFEVPRVAAVPQSVQPVATGKQSPQQLNGGQQPISPSLRSPRPHGPSAAFGGRQSTGRLAVGHEPLDRMAPGPLHYRPSDAYCSKFV